MPKLNIGDVVRVRKMMGGGSPDLAGEVLVLDGVEDPQRSQYPNTGLIRGHRHWFYPHELELVRRALKVGDQVLTPSERRGEVIFLDGTLARVRVPNMSPFGLTGRTGYWEGHAIELELVMPDNVFDPSKPFQLSTGTPARELGRAKLNGKEIIVCACLGAEGATPDTEVIARFWPDGKAVVSGRYRADLVNVPKYVDEALYTAVVAGQLRRVYQWREAKQVFEDVLDSPVARAEGGLLDILPLLSRPHPEAQ